MGRSVVWDRDLRADPPFMPPFFHDRGARLDLFEFQKFFSLYILPRPVFFRRRLSIGHHHPLWTYVLGGQKKLPYFL